MKILLEKNRAIHVCKLDGKVVSNLQVAEKDFAAATVLEIESIPLQEALATTLHSHLTEIRALEQKCEQLVTDCLLAEPQEIVDQWTEICETTKHLLGYVPSLAPILNEEKLEKVMEPLFAEMNSLMAEAGKSFSVADVVTFSDVLENRLIPWLKKFRELMQSALQEVESFPKPS